jgi:hypothetical protein
VTDISTSAPDAVWVCDHAWLGGPDLSANVAIECRDGTITSITVGGSRPTGAERLRGVVLPGLVNAHSHAFHRLLRGRTHRQGGDFWLWRDRMYQAAAMLTPESYERLATAVFVEMAMAGITSVGEFHYLHHEADGAPYQDANEMGHAMVRAARAAGLRLGLLDAGYFAAGLDGRPLDPVQERFHDPSPSAWLDRVDDLRGRYDPDRDVVVGLAPHSVRAVPESALREVAERRPGSVVHIHLSEQPAENAACLDATGATPTGLLDRRPCHSPDARRHREHRRRLVCRLLLRHHGAGPRRRHRAGTGVVRGRCGAFRGDRFTRHHRYVRRSQGPRDACTTVPRPQRKLRPTGAAHRDQHGRGEVAGFRFGWPPTRITRRLRRDRYRFPKTLRDDQRARSRLDRLHRHELRRVGCLRVRQADRFRGPAPGMGRGSGFSFPRLARSIEGPPGARPIERSHR